MPYWLVRVNNNEVIGNLDVGTYVYARSIYFHNKCYLLQHCAACDLRNGNLYTHTHDVLSTLDDRNKRENYNEKLENERKEKKKKERNKQSATQHIE